MTILVAALFMAILSGNLFPLCFIFALLQIILLLVFGLSICILALTLREAVLLIRNSNLLQ